MKDRDWKLSSSTNNKTSKSTKALGDAAELTACDFLERSGLILKATNYQCKLGEIDLIMLEQQVLVFVEVRMRNSEGYGSGAETVTLSKQTKIIRTAQHFLSANPHLSNQDCRFDVVSLSKNKQKIDWYKNAFTLDR